MSTQMLTDIAYEYFSSLENSAPVIITSPHSGRSYPGDFDYDCRLEKLKRLEDRKVDIIYDGLWFLGAHVIFARKPRSYIDLSRARDCINPDDIKGPVSTLDFKTKGDNERYLRGRTGLIFMRSGINNFIIYDRDNYPTEADIIGRLEIWDSFHGVLSDVIAQQKTKSNNTYHLDMHSCWRSVTTKNRTKKFRPDVTISNNFGRSASAEFTGLVEDGFKDRGLNVQINDPFKGGLIVRKYGAPETGQECLQIEIARDLYMDEKANEIDVQKMQFIQQSVRGVVEDVIDFSRALN